MEPLFPAADGQKKERPKWLSVGSSFPDLPSKPAHQSPVRSPSASPPPCKRLKVHRSPPTEPPLTSLSNYSEFDVIDNYGVVQVLKWRLDFGRKDEIEFSTLAGYEVPRYSRVSTAFIGKRTKDTDDILKMMDVRMGGTKTEKKKPLRYYEAKWTGNATIAVSGEGNLDVFLRRTKELNSTLNSDPTNVDAWLGLVDIQEKSIAGKKAQSQIAEKQLAILDKALRSLHGAVSEAKLKLLMRKVTLIAKSDMEMSLWKYREVFPASVAFWSHCLYLENSKFEQFTVTSMREGFKSALRELRERDDSVFLRIKVWLVGQLAMYESLVKVTQAGYEEVSTALLQAFLMRVFFHSESELVQKWDEELPRIGEKSPVTNAPLKCDNPVPEHVTTASWLQAETQGNNWLPLKASLQPDASNRFPSAVVFSGDVSAAFLAVPEEVTSDYKDAAIQLSLNFYLLQLTCSNCQSDAQLLQWNTVSEAAARRLRVKEDCRLKLEFIANVLGEVDEVYPHRDLKLWLVALERELHQQHWTKLALSKTDDLEVWMTFASASEKAWSGLRKKVEAAAEEARIVFFYRSFQRTLWKPDSDLGKSVSELLLVFGDTDILSAISHAKTAIIRYKDCTGSIPGFSLAHLSCAAAIWLTYFQGGLREAWNLFESFPQRDPAQCGEVCTREHDEWLCEEVCGVLRYHQSHSHVYMKTDISDRLAQLLSLFPRNPLFLLMYIAYFPDPLQALRKIIAVDEFHYALLLDSLTPWQRDCVLKEARITGNFPDHPHSTLHLLLKTVSGTEAESRALTGICKLPFCKSMYLAAFSASQQGTSVIAALADKELHLRFDPFSSLL